MRIFLGETNNKNQTEKKKNNDNKNINLDFFFFKLANIIFFSSLSISLLCASQ